MKRHLEISAFILGGGASSRMGSDKGLLEFGNEPLVLRTARLLEPLVHEVTIVGNPEQYSNLGSRVIPDRTVGAGTESNPVRTPLVGIATALTVTTSPWNLVLACDLPYLTRGWIDWLLDRAAISTAQIVMPRTPRGLEPLAALYRRECAAPILRALERGIRKVTDAISQLQTEYVDETEWSLFDPEHWVLKNMNSPEDYLEAKSRLENTNRGA
ncbi:MAG TPA: molybdenum cofactor guanylyltransferase [Candidatus Sulfotelmatobacter sp.]|jgi:molybdenum cofactor guanylyltransferase|nr:molybdenum cofactor guanylyltransferase [Candidatus Sulfotelmatobacter sp.]